MKANLRSIACEIAKVLGRQRGTAPNKQLSEAWKLAKEGKTPSDLTTKGVSFFAVTYKGVKGNYKKSIVPSVNETEARKKFFDPEDPIGPKNEVIKVASPRKIPKDWYLVVDNGEDYLNVKVEEDIMIVPGKKVQTTVGDIELSEIVAANPPRKEAVL